MGFVAVKNAISAHVTKWQPFLFGSLLMMLWRQTPSGTEISRRTGKKPTTGIILLHFIRIDLLLLAQWCCQNVCTCVCLCSFSGIMRSLGNSTLSPHTSYGSDRFCLWEFLTIELSCCYHRKVRLPQLIRIQIQCCSVSTQCFMHFAHHP